MRALPREPDEQIRSRILGYASTAWWRFLDQRQRDSRGAAQAVRIDVPTRPARVVVFT